ncbi:MAG: hypothetical protein H0W88_07060 [Parachlamydiaceae bacterium]|nr:hypothetical protein [Parachlamydiaceae bacterium]
MIKELNSIQNREDLLKALPKVQQQCNELVDVMIAAQEFKEKNPMLQNLQLTQENHELNDQLRMALNHVYKLEGGREFIENCQEQSLHRLEMAERKIRKIKTD